jgi:hypothetical protein
MNAQHPGIAADVCVRIARADAVEHLLGGANALLEGVSTGTPVEDLALRKADALRDAAFAAGLRWAAAQARTQGLDRFSASLAEEAEEIAAESKRVTAVADSPFTAAPPRAQEVSV